MSCGDEQAAAAGFRATPVRRRMPNPPSPPTPCPPTYAQLPVRQRMRDPAPVPPRDPNNSARRNPEALNAIHIGRVKFTPQQVTQSSVDRGPQYSPPKPVERASLDVRR